MKECLGAERFPEQEVRISNRDTMKGSVDGHHGRGGDVGPKRAEIYTYEFDHEIYAMNWSVRPPSPFKSVKPNVSLSLSTRSVWGASQVFKVASSVFHPTRRTVASQNGEACVVLKVRGDTVLLAALCDFQVCIRK